MRALQKVPVPAVPRPAVSLPVPGEDDPPCQLRRARVAVPFEDFIGEIAIAVLEGDAGVPLERPDEPKIAGAFVPGVEVQQGEVALGVAEDGDLRLAIGVHVADFDLTGGILSQPVVGFPRIGFGVQERVDVLISQHEGAQASGFRLVEERQPFGKAVVGEVLVAETEQDGVADGGVDLRCAGVGELRQCRRVGRRDGGRRRSCGWRRRREGGRRCGRRRKGGGRRGGRQHG